MSKTYTIGVDYGTDTVRAVIVQTDTGEIIAESVFEYPGWKEGRYCNASENQFRQHPSDYIEGLKYTIKKVVAQCGPEIASKITGISADTTGSTPVPVNREGVPLSLLPEFKDNPNAMFILWKDHTATAEADEINELSRSWGGVDYTKYEGGIYSSEWFWAKVLKVLRTDPEVRNAAYSWVEHCDWIPGLLTGNTDPLVIKRSRCAAGHKAMWHTDWDGLPSEKFLVALDPLLSGLRDRLYKDSYTSDVSAGFLSQEWADELGLTVNVAIGVGAFDAHIGAVGGEVKPYYMSKVMGTSTCDMLVVPEAEVGSNLVKGICGQVDGSISPGLIGLEAGQSAFGDIYAWFRDLLLWPVEKQMEQTDLLDDETKRVFLDELRDRAINDLSEAASKVPLDESGMVALDWMNGRRTPDANPYLKGVISGLSLGSDAPAVFRALVEATAFGSRAIAERFREEGVRIDGVIALGGVAKKSPFVMQTVADVMNMPILVAKSEQTCALGAAMAASVVAGTWSTFEEAQEKMGAGYEKEYIPDKISAEKYNKLYHRYISLGKFIEDKLTDYPAK
ncbi:MAG: ribulokinase [Bacteroidales bacterium]|nr:ribulokinase [Bacteroidales bacterium]